MNIIFIILLYLQSSHKLYIPNNSTIMIFIYLQKKECYIFLLPKNNDPLLPLKI